MLNSQPLINLHYTMMSQAEVPPAILSGDAEVDLWLYRPRTIALLRRYARASVEVGCLPSLLGREFFRSRVTSYSMGSFEDIVIFVTDMEHAVDKLDNLQRQLVAMNVLEEYSIPEMSRLLTYPQRTTERLLQGAIDDLSRILLATHVLESLPVATRGVTQRRSDYRSLELDRKDGPWERCQGGKTRLSHASCSEQGKKKLM